MVSKGCASFALLFLAAGISVYGQINQASLQGTVTDNTGAVVPNATIELKDKGTSVARTAKTNGAGEYDLPNLDPTEYSLTITYTGFKSFVVSSLILHTGEHSTVNASLEV